MILVSRFRPFLSHCAKKTHCVIRPLINFRSETLLPTAVFIILDQRQHELSALPVTQVPTYLRYIHAAQPAGYLPDGPVRRDLFH